MKSARDTQQAISEAACGNQQSWDAGADAYAAAVFADAVMRPLLENPKSCFHPTTWGLIERFIPDVCGKHVLVPSSGDNHAVFALAMMGAQVTSSDISQKQLDNARRYAEGFGWHNQIDFVWADTMRLDGIEDAAYDFVYTSNGVHVWIQDLPGMYRNIHRVLVPGGVSIMYDIHPMQRPFNDDAVVVKPYDRVGPHVNGDETKFAWRLMDIMNAMLESRLRIAKIEEMYAQKSYIWPFFVSLAEFVAGKTVTREEVDDMYDWQKNPLAALPSWLSIAATKER